MVNRRNFLCKSCLMAGAALGCGSITSSASEGAEDCKTRVKELQEQLAGQQLSHYPQLVGIIKALEARFGPGVVEVIKQDTIDNARQNKTILTLPKEKRDLSAVKSFWDEAAGMVDFKIVEQTPEKLVFRVSRCKYAEAIKKAGGSPELGFALNCAYDNGLWPALNPALKFTRTKTLMMGDDCCDHAYELKKS